MSSELYFLKMNTECNLYRLPIWYISKDKIPSTSSLAAMCPILEVMQVSYVTK